MSEAIGDDFCTCRLFIALVWRCSVMCALRYWTVVTKLTGLSIGTREGDTITFDDCVRSRLVILVVLD